MRLTRCGLLSMLLVLAGCRTDPETAPPVIREPTAGATFDRALVRVHTETPVPDTTVTVGNASGLAAGAHVNWRVNGGESHEISSNAFDRAPTAPLLFGATLVPGANTLEVGRCNAFDECGYTPVTVTLKTAPGSPDPAFRQSGQYLEPKGSNVKGVRVLPDGRVLVVSEPGAAVAGRPPASVTMMLKADGALDTTWGERGYGTLPFLAAFDDVITQPDGSFLFLGSRRTDVTYVVKTDAHGAVDATYGDPAIGPGLRLMPLSPEGGVSVWAVRQDVDGSVWVAGSVFADASKYTGFPAMLWHLDAALNTLAFKLLDFPVLNAAATGNPFRGASINSHGEAAFVFADGVGKGSLAGVDARFGDRGVAPMTTAGWSGAVVMREDSGVTAVVPLPEVTTTAVTWSARVFWRDATGQGASYDVPFHAPQSASVQDLPLLATEGKEGVVYVGSSREASGEGWFPWLTDTGTDFVLAALGPGGLRPDFGVGGMAWASFRVAWQPASTEPTTDEPFTLVTDPDGRPYLGGRTMTGGQAGAQLQLRRGPGAALVRFLP